MGSPAERALADAGGLDGIASISIAAQQHGMVCLDEDGKRHTSGTVVERPEIGACGRSTRHRRSVLTLGHKVVGSVPLAAFTVSKLRWLAEHELENARRTVAVCLPHDWLTWRFLGSQHDHGLTIESLTTDRSDASGTGYWSPITDEYRFDLLERALGRMVGVPESSSRQRARGSTALIIFGAGAGDNASAALVAGQRTGDVIVSVGTSGTAFASSDVLMPDSSGTVAGFADATGHYLPLVCTVNASRVLEALPGFLASTSKAVGSGAVGSSRR